MNKHILILFPHMFTAIILLAFLVAERLDLIYLLLSLVFILASYYYFVRLHLKRNLNKSICEIRKSINDEWSLVLKNKSEQRVSILPSSFSSRFLIILNFQNTDIKKDSYSAIITPDSISIEEFRRLKVFIKTKKLSV